MKNLQNLNLVELNAQEVKEIEGGFVPLVILGVTYSAKTVAAAAGACFIAGLGIGALAASDQRK